MRLSTPIAIATLLTTALANPGNSTAKSPASGSGVPAPAATKTGGSIEALLQRYSERTRKAINKGTLPDELAGDAGDKDGHRDEDVAPVKNQTKRDARMARRHGPNRILGGGGGKGEKRWIWATTIIQDSSPTDGVPPPGQNSNGLGSYAVDTPTAVPTPPTFPPIASSTADAPGVKIVASVSSAASAASATVVPCRKTSQCSGFAGPSHSHPYCDPKKHVCVSLCDKGFTLNPWTKQCQKNGTQPNNVPRYVIASEIHSKLSHDLAEHSSATAAPVHKRHGGHGHRRWVWGPSIIQDGDTVAPPAGVNTNLLSNGFPVDTPSVVLTPPTYAPEPPTSATSVAADTSATPLANKQVTPDTGVSQREEAGRVIAAVLASASEAAAMQSRSAIVAAAAAVAAGPSPPAKFVKLEKPKVVKTLFPTMFQGENDAAELRRRSGAKETRSIDISEEVIDESQVWEDEEWEDIVILEDK